MFRCFHCSWLSISAQKNWCSNCSREEESFEATVEMEQPLYNNKRAGNQDMAHESVQKIIRDCPVREFHFEYLKENLNEAEVTSPIPIEGYGNLTGPPKLGNLISTSEFDRSHLCSKEVSRGIDASSGSEDREIPDDAQNESKKRLTTDSDIDRKNIEMCSPRSGKIFSPDGIQCDISQETVKELGKRNQIVSDLRDLAGRDQDFAHENISSEASAKGKTGIVDKILANTEPSFIQIKKNKSNIFEENLLCSNLSEIQSAEKEDTFICKICNMYISIHKKKGDTPYECCKCSYKSYKPKNLHIHSDINRDLKTCNICQKNYAEDEPHEKEYTCVACNKKLQCKTHLNEHFFKHLEHFATHCWKCNEHFKNHWKKLDEKRYVCCFCEYESLRSQNLLWHYNTHRPNPYCKLCKEEYDEEKIRSHSKKYTCHACNEKFECVTFLEDHYIHQNVSLDRHCLICKQEMDRHMMEHEQQTFYKCCKCDQFVTDVKSNFKQHLLQCSGLRPFKCKACGKRLSRQRSVNSHYRSCPAVSRK